MDGCPYSVFEDGNDVKDYIIPPKGYVFVGFKFEPLINNQIYDGKLVAQYEKSSIKERLTKDIWKILVPVIIVAVIALVVILAIGIFKDHKPKNPEPKSPKTETVGTTIDSTNTQIENTVAPNDTLDQEENSEISDLTNNQQVVEEQEKPQTPAEDPNVEFKNAFW